MMTTMLQMAKRDPSTWAPLRTYRCEDELYEAVKAKVAAEDRTVTDVILAAFAEYIENG